MKGAPMSDTTSRKDNEIEASSVDGILEVTVPLDDNGDVTAKRIKVRRA